MSEMSDDMFDFIIENNGTLKGLKKEAKRVVKLLSMPNTV
jgi:dephospho-CoA kinase